VKIIVLNSYEDAKRIYGTALDIENVIVKYTPDIVISPIQLLEKEKPDVVLTSLEWLPYQRILISEANLRNIPTIYVMDGVLEWSYVWNNQSFVIPHGTVLQPLLSKHIAVIGNHPARILSSMGLSNKISIIGLPRLEGFSRERIVKLDVKKKILICTANTAYHNLEQEINLKQALSDMKDIVVGIDGVEIIWRLSSNLANDFLVDNNQDDFFSILKTVDAVISFQSTAIIEAMLLGIPTALIDYRNVPIYFQTAWQIRCKEHILNVIQELLHPPVEKKAYQDFCLNDELFLTDSSDRLKKIILNAGAALDDMPLDNIGGVLDYRVIHPQISAFGISNTTQLQYQLDGYAKYQKIINDRLYQIYMELKTSLLFKIIDLFPSGFFGLSKIKRAIQDLKSIIDEK
jgi:hypothetical protein